MNVQPDFRELLVLFNERKIEYLFQKPERVIQLGVPPVRIDLITSITGVSWEQADAGKAAGTCGDVDVNYLGRDEYIRNKRATGRKKDLADLEALGEE